jgi:hypothetical protein
MTSFGKYFDDQRDGMIRAMQNKNAQQNIEWMERYEKRQAKRHELQFLKERLTNLEKLEKKLLQEMIEENDREE